MISRQCEDSVSCSSSCCRSSSRSSCSSNVPSGVAAGVALSGNLMETLYRCEISLIFVHLLPMTMR